MMPGDEHSTTARTADVRRRGFTLVELVLSLTIMAILLGAMASAILIASHAVPNGQSPLATAAETADVVDQIAGELLYATSITRATGYAVTFTVADRGHGAVGPETISYAWSGTPGDPLTRQYNGGTVVTVSEEVQDFSLSYFVEPGELLEPPAVLLVVEDASSPSNKDPERQAAIESWGCAVRLISASASQADFDSAVAICDMAYLSETIWSGDLGTKLVDAPIGVVDEEPQLYDEFGISSDNGDTDKDDIEILDNTHEITSGFATGNLVICSSKQRLTVTRGTLAAGAQILAEKTGASHDGMLVVIEAGGSLYDGNTAAGRRVKLPWGQSGGFDFDSLNGDGLTLMRRAIEWAAVPQVCTGVQTALQSGPDSTSRYETQVQLLNAPEVSGP